MVGLTVGEVLLREEIITVVMLLLVTEKNVIMEPNKIMEVLT
jgi:hypothetical protein